jgi:acetylornithine deacetylase/succinyl-diaminopimelate desuccinylase-like protein
MDDDALIGLLSDLIAAESVNPAYPAPASGESAAVAIVESECRRLGLDTERQEVLPGRDNLIARLAVRGASRTLLFEAHTDTVSLDGMGVGGLTPAIRDGRLYGRGACDDKGSVAAMIGALAILLERRSELRTNVLFVAAADEEYQFRGVLKYLERRDEISAGIVGEPTDLRLVIAHKGVVRFRITTRGLAAHSSAPDRGHNAIEDMADVIALLASTKRRLDLRHPDLLGSPTMSIGRIEGGTGVNIVPDRCTIEVDRRFIPGETAEDALREIDHALASLAMEPGVRIEREDPFLVSPALDTPADAAIACVARETLSKFGLPTDPVGMAGGTDASKLWSLRRIPSIVLGPGPGQQAHTDDEYIELKQLTLGAHVYADLALRYSRLTAG